MPKPHIALVGKTIKKLTQLRGGGSAFPGLVVEKLDPNFLSSVLSQLPEGVIVISGTNGKTTTTKIVVDLLESQNYKVFTNKTGSNFTRGVASALINDMSWSGNLDADIAVLELDEAHAVHFVKAVKPRYSLLLNVLRDQLDRFGEIDYTASLLKTIGENTQNSVVLNRDDPRLGAEKFISSLTVPTYTFGVAPELEKLFPSDDELHDTSDESSLIIRDSQKKYYNDDTTLAKINVDSSEATFEYNTQSHTVKLKLAGIYNLLNAAAGIALTRVVVGKNLDESALYRALSKITPAFGRGEVIDVNGDSLELVLVKNPSGFRLALSSFDPAKTQTMIAINDDYADGRDMSWLWDVDFDSLAEKGVHSVSGIRAYDMNLRLKYDEVDVKNTDPDLKTSLRDYIELTKGSPKRIFCTYTAMIELRSQLSEITDVEEAIS